MQDNFDHFELHNSNCIITNSLKPFETGKVIQKLVPSVWSSQYFVLRQPLSRKYAYELIPYF